MSWQAPNLASRRYENLRPVRRVAGLLAALALLLTAWNVGTWWRTGAGAAEKRAELERLVQEAGQARARVETLERDLAAADLEAENRQARFLNARIDERAFSWNGLLDDLTEALPREVRLRQLAPQREARRGDEAARPAALERPGARSVALRIDGEAEDGEAMLAFVDALFAHPRFAEPNLMRETERPTGLVEFDLTVEYRPGDERPPEAAP
jgi:hypothetical protein